MAETLFAGLQRFRGDIVSAGSALDRLNASLQRRLDACKAMHKEHAEHDDDKKKKKPFKAPSLWWASGHVGQQGNDADPWHPPRYDDSGQEISNRPPAGTPSTGDNVPHPLGYTWDPTTGTWVYTGGG